MKKIFLILFLALFFVIFWNVARYIYAVVNVDPFFGDINYGISVFRDVLLPAVLGATVGFLTTLRGRSI